MFNFYDIETFIKESDSVWISLLVTFIGTLLGFLGAFYLSKWTERKQINKEKQQKISSYKDRLHYLSQLIETSLKILNDQLDNFEDLAKDLIQDPIEQHLLKIVASNDLLRLQNMDTEEVFHAYHLIMPENDDKIKDYKNIYGSIDFLYLRLKQALDSTDKNVNFTHRDQMYIKDTVEHLSNEIYAWIKDLEKRSLMDSPEYIFLVKSHKEYMKLIEDKAKIGNFETDFLIPFGTELRQSFPKTDFFNEFNDLTSKAIIRFNHIKENATVFAAELRDLRNEMRNSIDTLTEINENLTCHNNALS
jgi:hypothetical protein